LLGATVEAAGERGGTALEAVGERCGTIVDDDA